MSTRISTELIDVVQERISSGEGHAEITTELSAAGYTESEIEEIFQVVQSGEFQNDIHIAKTETNTMLQTAPPTWLLGVTFLILSIPAGIMVFGLLRVVFTAFTADASVARYIDTIVYFSNLFLLAWWLLLAVMFFLKKSLVVTIGSKPIRFLNLILWLSVLLLPLLIARISASLILHLGLWRILGNIS